jgi:hypothetical protein
LLCYTPSFAKQENLILDFILKFKISLLPCRILLDAFESGNKSGVAGAQLIYSGGKCYTATREMHEQQKEIVNIPFHSSSKFNYSCLGNLPFCSLFSFASFTLFDCCLTYENFSISLFWCPIHLSGLAGEGYVLCNA